MKTPFAAGFTLIELLVVSAVVVLFSALAGVSWRFGQGDLALQRTAQKAAQDVKRAEELALRAQSFSCATGKISGYGIYFSMNSSSYIIFADCNANQRYDAGTDGVVETISPEPGVSVYSVSHNAVSVVFVPPDPSVTIIDGSGTSLLSAQISFAMKSDSSQRKSVQIDQKGTATLQ